MASYALTDPALQTQMDRLAAAEAADWPAPDPEALAVLARLLRPLPARPSLAVTEPAAARRAA